MPHFNMWAPRTGAFIGNQLQYQPHTNLRGGRKVEHFTDFTQSRKPDYGLGTATQMALGFANRNYYGRWMYPSEKINVSTRTRAKYMPRSYTMTTTEKKKKRKRRTCCRLIKGKKVCEPRFCSKNKYW